MSHVILFRLPVDLSGLMGVCDSSRGDRREYLFEQVVLFFVQYASAVDPSAAAPEERPVINDMMKKAGLIAEAAGDMDKWTPRESWLLEQLVRVAFEYCAGSPSQPFDADTGFVHQEEEIELDGNTLSWGLHRRRDCHFANTPSPSLLKHLQREGGGQQNDSSRRLVGGTCSSPPPSQTTMSARSGTRTEWSAAA